MVVVNKFDGIQKKTKNEENYKKRRASGKHFLFNIFMPNRYQ